MEKNDEKKVVKQELEEKDLEQATGGKKGGPCPFILLQEQDGDEKQWFFNGKLKIMEKQKDKKIVKQELSEDDLKQATGCGGCKPLVILILNE